MQIVKDSEQTTKRIIKGLRDLLTDDISILDRTMLYDISELARRLGVKANLYGRGGANTDILSAVHSLNIVLSTPAAELALVNLIDADTKQLIDASRTLELIADKATSKAVQVQNAMGAL